MRGNNLQRAFTFVEVIAALTIVSIALVALLKLSAGGVNSYNLGGATFWVVIAAVFFWFARKALVKRGAR